MNLLVRFTSRPRRIIATAAVLLLAATITTLALTHRSRDEQTRYALTSLSPVLPDLGAGQQIVLSHPDCDNYPPCTSVSQTWTHPPAMTFTALNDRLGAWATRNHLRWLSPHWLCGSSGYYLFGDKRPGCQAEFLGSDRSRPITLGITLTGQSVALYRDTLKTKGDLEDPMPLFAQRLVDTVALQVVGNRDSRGHLFP